MIPSAAKKMSRAGNAGQPVSYFLMMSTSNLLRNAIKNFGTREVSINHTNPPIQKGFPQ
jgi:hypothetical protein